MHPSTKMSHQDNGIGNFSLNEDEIQGTTFDIFTLPERENSILSGKEVEIRLFTVLDRFVRYFCYIKLQYTLP